MAGDSGLVYHCIKCGGTWGSGYDTESHGICPDCFAKWYKKRQKEKGLKECFGEFGQAHDLYCDGCILIAKCKEYYGIKQNLLR